jgi:hypothetical protein
MTYNRLGTRISHVLLFAKQAHYAYYDQINTDDPAQESGRYEYQNACYQCYYRLKLQIYVHVFLHGVIAWQKLHLF